MWGALIYEYPVPPPRLPSPDTVGADTHSSHHRHFVEDRAAMRTTIAAAAEWVIFVLLWGPCSAEHAEHA